MRTITRRSSGCVKRMFVSLKDANALVTFKDGSMYYYENVSRKAMLNLMLNKNMSLGFWVNANLVNSDRAVCFDRIPKINNYPFIHPIIHS
jgi:hypothetical protein